MKMDWQRTAYIAGIFIIGFMLLQEWEQFHHDRQDIYSQQQSQAETIVSEADLPQATSSQEQQAAVENNGLPQAVTNNSVPPSTTDSTADNQLSTSTLVEQLIHIKTDTLEVEIDRNGGDIIKVSLPQHKIKQGEEDNYILLQRSVNGTFIAKSGIVGPNATDTSKGRPIFDASGSEYSLKEGEDTLQVDLTTQQNGVVITKRFTFTRNDYLINIEYIINNQSSSAWEGGLYGQIVRDDHIPLSTGDSGLGVVNFLGAATTTQDENYKKIQFEDLNKTEPFFKEQGQGWMALVQHYFVSVWLPNSQVRTKYSFSRSQNGINTLTFSSATQTVNTGETGILSAGFYVGPKNIKRLEELAPYLDLTLDFGFLWWIAKPLFQFLSFIHSFVGNWGWSIILLTLAIKLVFFYPSAVSYRSMAKMRKLSPKMADLKERFGDDRQKMSQEMMKLYKTEKVNPMGGCLPILIQMPVFISLYWALIESVELRHAPFMFWIIDLSVKDPLFIFPLLMGATMFIQQRLNPTPPDPMQAKIMKWMPVGFTVMFLWFPAGLVIYWVTNNTLSIIQQYLITKKIESEP